MSGRRGNGEGSIYKDATSGRWAGQITLDGKRRKVRGRTRAEVTTKLDMLKQESAAGIVRDGRMTVGQLLATWRERTVGNRDLAPASIENYDLAVRVLTAELGDVKLVALDVDGVERALDQINDRAARPLSRRTLKLYRATLAKALDLAVRRRMIGFNPARIAELNPTAPKTAPRRSLNSNEAEALWASCEGERLGNLWRLMLVTGLRPGEAIGLCWDAVDLDAGLLHVRRAVRREHGRAVLVDEVKTAGSWRTIGLPVPAIDVLRAQRKVVAELKLAARVWAKVDADLVFPTAEGTPWDLSNARDELTASCAEAGIERITPHELRHSCASILNDRGVPLELIADLLGHVDTTMLSRVYRHRLRPSADAAVAVMGEMFGAVAVS